MRPMPAACRCLIGFFVLVGLTGCDDPAGDPPPLASGAAAAAPTRAVDPGILSDQGSVTAVEIPRVEGEPVIQSPSAAAAAAAAGATGMAMSDGNPEVAAIRAVGRANLESVLAGDFAGVLDSFNPEQIEALQGDFIDNLLELQDAMQLLWAAVDDKAAEDPVWIAAKDLLADLPKFVDPLVAGQRIEMLSDTEALVVLDAELTQQGMQAVGMQLLPKLAVLQQAAVSEYGFDPSALSGDPNGMGGMLPPGMGAMMGGGGPMDFNQMMGMQTEQTSHMIKRDGRWYADLGFSIDASTASTLAEGVRLATQFVEKAVEGVEASEATRLPEIAPAFQTAVAQMQQDFSTWGQRAMPVLMGVAMQAMAAQQSMPQPGEMPAGEAPAAEGNDAAAAAPIGATPPGGDEPTSGQDPNN